MAGLGSPFAVDPGTTHAAMDAFAQSLAAAGSSTPADAVTAAKFPELLVELHIVLD
jgi:hypothetical protein